jgi:hypothetical protein
MVGDGVVNPFMWLPYLRRVCLYGRACLLPSELSSGPGLNKLASVSHRTQIVLPC